MGFLNALFAKFGRPKMSPLAIVWVVMLVVLVLGSLGCGRWYYSLRLPAANHYFLAFYFSSIIWIFLKTRPVKPAWSTWKFIFLVAVIYTVLHLAVWRYAPWNENGMFDDAAWDIYLMKKHLFRRPWQTLYFDRIGFIDREYIFHNFVAGWLGLFGYSIKAFNYGLLFLGGWTVVFSGLIVRQLFTRNVAFVATVFMTLLPFHYTHQFIGHRYAIAPPLLAMTMYFFLLGQKAAPKNKSWYFCWTGVWLGLTVMSSIMGRQALYASAVVGALHLLPILIRRLRQRFARSSSAAPAKSLALFGPGIKDFLRQKRWYFLIAGVLLLMLLPHIFYILHNYDYYFAREQGLVSSFWHTPHVMQKNLYNLWSLLFSPVIGTFTQGRFSIDAPSLPYYFTAIWAIGLYYLGHLRQYWFLALSLIPLLGSWVAGPIDFRYYFAIPSWFVALGAGLAILLQEGRRLAAQIKNHPAPKFFTLAYLQVIIVVIFLLIGPFGRRPLSMYISRYLYEIMAVVLIVVGLVWAWSVFAKRTNPTLGRWQYLAAFGIVLLGGGGLIDSTFVILYLRHHPHDFYLMEHYEIGRARMMQDILEGRENPSPQKHRPHELRLELTPAPSYFGVCSMSFGVVHLFMDQHRLPYDLFRFCPAPTTILSWEKLWQNHVTFWLSLNTSLAPTYVFMWDYMRTTRDLYDFLKKAHPPGTLRMITRRGEGHKLKVFYLKMTAAELQKWQKKLVKVNGEFLARKKTKDAQPTPAPTPTPLPTPTPTPSTTAAQQIFPRFTASAGPRVIVPTDSPAMTK